MHIAAFLLVCVLFWARPSLQHPQARLQRTTGCACRIAGAEQKHVFWTQPPDMENPGDTCGRMEQTLQHWLTWIDGHMDLDAAWQLYDDILQNRRANPAALQRPFTATTDPEPVATPAAQIGGVSCVIESMEDTSRAGTMLSDILLVRVLLGAILLLVLYESFSTLFRNARSKLKGRDPQGRWL